LACFTISRIGSCAWRTAGEPLIWHDAPWIVGSKRYSHQAEIFIEDGLWPELDPRFPGQLNAQRVGKGADGPDVAGNGAWGSATPGAHGMAPARNGPTAEPCV